jgi:sugar phosphate isomerase/epimerase
MSSGHSPRFRLGSTSYVYPAGLAENSARLAGIAEDMELVLFETPDQSNLPDIDTVQQLSTLAQRAGMSYTVHLPRDLTDPEPAATGCLSHSMRLALHVMATTAPLAPYAYVAHLDGRVELAQGPAADWAGWRSRRIEMLRRLLARCPRPDILCIENLEHYPIDELLPILDALPVSLCLDVGHLWLDGLDPISIYQRFRSRIRVIHLHGLGSGAHQSLQSMPREPTFQFLDELHRTCYDGVLTLEVFGTRDFFSSRDVILEWNARQATRETGEATRC